MSIAVLAVQEKVDPRLKVLLVSRLVIAGRWRFGDRRIDGICQGDAGRHDNLLFAGRGQTKVLPRRQLQILIAIEVIILQHQVVILELLNISLLAKSGDLFLQAVIGLDGFNTAPTDQQHDHHEQHLPGKADIAQPADKVTDFIKNSFYLHRLLRHII